MSRSDYLGLSIPVGIIFTVIFLWFNGPNRIANMIAPNLTLIRTIRAPKEVHQLSGEINVALKTPDFIEIERDGNVLQVLPNYVTRSHEPNLTLIDYTDQVNGEGLEDLLNHFIHSRLANAENISFVVPIQPLDDDELVGVTAEISTEIESQLVIQFIGQDEEDDLPTMIIPLTYELELIQQGNIYILSMVSYRTGIKEQRASDYQTMKLIKNTMEFIPNP